MRTSSLNSVPTSGREPNVDNVAAYSGSGSRGRAGCQNHSRPAVPPGRRRCCWRPGVPARPPWRTRGRVEKPAWHQARRPADRARNRRPRAVGRAPEFGSNHRTFHHIFRGTVPMYPSFGRPRAPARIRCTREATRLRPLPRSFFRERTRRIQSRPSPCAGYPPSPGHPPDA